MKFTYNGQVFSIRFAHGSTKSMLFPFPTERYTLCRVLIKPEGDTTKPSLVYAQGQADCHPNDMYCYETGRKLSLERALEGHPKTFRTAVWTCYLNRKQVATPAGV